MRLFQEGVEYDGSASSGAEDVKTEEGGPEHVDGRLEELIEWLILLVNSTFTEMQCASLIQSLGLNILRCSDIAKF